MWFGEFIPMKAWGPWCAGKNSKIHYADYDGDTNWDMICDDGKGTYSVKKSLYHYQDTYDGGQFRNYGVVLKNYCTGKNKQAFWGPSYAPNDPPHSSHLEGEVPVGSWSGNAADVFCDTSEGKHMMQFNKGHCYRELWMC